MSKPITFIVLFTIWLIWSGFYDPFHLTLGVVSSLIVVIWSGSLFIEKKVSFSQRMKEWLRFELYSIWLLWEIVLANIHVIRLSFHPDILEKLNPRLISFKTKVKGDVPQFILAQSLTLTPGTVTVRVEKDEFHVHAIDETFASGIPGVMEIKIAKMFKGSKV